jgi:FkbM family methyltransferase
MLKKSIFFLLTIIIKIARYLGDSTSALRARLIPEPIRNVEKPPVSEHEKNAIKWFKDAGDVTLRLQYDLGPQSVVFDVGGYYGEWASHIFSAYLCRVNIFEPVHEYALRIEKRFKNNKNITVHHFGLAGKTQQAMISILKDSSSIYRVSDEEKTEAIELVSIGDFIREKKFTHIDLMKINIEGGEYELLEYLLSSGLTKIIDNLQVQFHEFIVKDYAERMVKIQKALSRTHRLTYQYRFVWENWQKK